MSIAGMATGVALFLVGMTLGVSIYGTSHSTTKRASAAWFVVGLVACMLGAALAVRLS